MTMLKAPDSLKSWNNFGEGYLPGFLGIKVRSNEESESEKENG